MKNLPQAVLALCCLSLLMTSGAVAQIDPNASVATINQPTNLLILPDGTGPTLGSTGAVITLTIVDVTGVPITNIAASDVEVDGFPPVGIADGFSPLVTHNLVPGGFSMGLPGQYAVTAALYAGGWSNAAIVKVRGLQIAGSPLPLAMNSPDISADGIVNLVDVGLFTQNLFGSYHFRSDFNPDGVINITDVGFMAAAIGVTFPPGYGVDPID